MVHPYLRVTSCIPHQKIGLSIERLDAILAQLCSERILLAVPKFELASEFSLAGTLAELGMPDAFQPGVADFSGMDGTHDLFIGRVMQKLTSRSMRKGPKQRPLVCRRGFRFRSTK